MIVNFRTRQGSTYCLNHDRQSFTQTSPIHREGPLWNVPPVKLGDRVVIWTEPDQPNAKAKVIQTDIVVHREVIIDAKHI